MSVSVQEDNIKETICHIMLSIKTQTKYIHFYCLCIAYSLSNQKWPNMHRLSRFGGNKANLLDCRAGNQLLTPSSNLHWILQCNEHNCPKIYMQYKSIKSHKYSFYFLHKLNQIRNRIQKLFALSYI